MQEAKFKRVTLFKCDTLEQQNSPWFDWKGQPKRVKYVEGTILRRVNIFAFIIILDLFMSPTKTWEINEIIATIRDNCMYWLFFPVLLFNSLTFSIFVPLSPTRCPFHVQPFTGWYIWYYSMFVSSICSHLR